MWVLAIMLLPFLLPMIVGMVLAVIFTRPRSDILALLASSLVLLGFRLLCLKFNYSISTSSALLSQDVTTATLIAATIASVSIELLIPFIFARWGVEAVDCFRSKHHPPLRRQSKGNLVLVVVFFVATLAQLLPTLIEKGVPTYFEARQKALQGQTVASDTYDITTTNGMALHLR